jgi:NADPH2:quinone reductase
MKAIRVEKFGGPEVLELAEIPEPAPGPGQVTVRIKAVGVNPVDTYVRSGTYASKPPLPYTPGSDAAGTVERVGPDVGDVRAGDRVYLSGAVSGVYAEVALCERAQVHRLPERVTFQQGAAMGVPYATAYRGLIQRAHAQAGDVVLVHGATGGVGIAATQLARSLGMHVITTGGSEKGRALLGEQGIAADDIFDHSSAGYLDRILARTGGRGVDVILEMAAHINLANDLGLLARNGRVVVIGNRGPIEVNARMAMARDAAILGMTLFNVSPDDLRRIHTALVAGLANGTLRPIVGQELPLARAADAQRAVIEQKAFGKIVLIP